MKVKTPKKIFILNNSMSHNRLDHLMICDIYQEVLDDIDELAKEFLPRETTKKKLYF